VVPPDGSHSGLRILSGPQGTLDTVDSLTLTNITMMRLHATNSPCCIIRDSPPGGKAAREVARSAAVFWPGVHKLDEFRKDGKDGFKMNVTNRVSQTRKY
jgi:hypothetical protein